MIKRKKITEEEVNNKIVNEIYQKEFYEFIKIDENISKKRGLYIKKNKLNIFERRRLINSSIWDTINKTLILVKIK